MESKITGPFLHSTVDVSAGRRSGEVYVSAGTRVRPGAAWIPPAQARELAAALLRAADEAEGREPVGAERNLLDFIERAGWDGSALVSAHRQQIRDEVARELEEMDGTNLGMSLVRTHAVNVARRGLTPRDTQHDRTLGA